MSGEAPCRCMTYNAPVSAWHPGHCCFVPATQTCHPDEFAAWEAKYRRAAARPGATEEER